MNQPQNTFDIASKILSIKLVEFNVLDKLPKGKKIDIDKIHFEFETSVKIEPSKQQLNVELKTMFYTDNKKKIVIGHINTVGKFLISNIIEILEQFNKSIPTELIAMFIGALLSTTRGILLIKSEKTIMDGIAIPMVDVRSFFDKKN